MQLAERLEARARTLRARNLLSRNIGPRSFGVCARTSALLVTLTVLGVTSPAQAQEAPEASPAGETLGAPDADRVVWLNEEGARLYASAEYRQALARFKEAYSLEPDPHLLFNMASCHQGLGDSRAALENYRAFLRAPGTDPEGRARAEQAIEALEAEIAASQAAPAPANPPLLSVQAEPASSWLDDPLVPWVAVGTGAAALLLGSSLYALGASDHGRLEETPGFGDRQAVTGLTRAEARELLDSGNTKKTIGGVSIALGAAVLATYGVLLLVRAGEGGSEPAPEHQLAVVPVRKGAALSFGGSF